ncbi:MAG: PaaI family thioesterase [Pleurocapsa sp. SU_196_0]|nr:PaaI family thioesterase [Pleurocapsa sp. SU_196_0]
MSGLEFLQGVKDGTLPGSAMADTLEFLPVSLEAGRVVLEGTPGAYTYNMMGAVHGGYAAAMLDSVMACCVQSLLPAGTGYATVEMKVSLVRGMTAETGTVRAEGHVLHLGKNVATAEARLIGRDDGKLYAHATTTCLLFPLPVP